jgi:hypothetical protein
LSSFEKLIDNLKKVKNPKWSFVKTVYLVNLGNHHIHPWKI